VSILAVMMAACLVPRATRNPPSVAKSPANDRVRVEAESMRREGGGPLAREGWRGVALAKSRDALTMPFEFFSPGRWRFDVRGCSSNAQPVAVSVLIDGWTRASGWLASSQPEALSLLVDVDVAGEHEVRLRPTVDLAGHDALVDWIEIARMGDLTAPPTPPAQGAVGTGRWRNLFVLRGHPEAEVARKIAQAWSSLFQGDPDNEAVYFTSGSNANGALAYVEDVGHGDVRSEGMSYGMMIAVELDHKAEFDALWNWAKTYMAHPDPEDPVHGYFAWQVRPDGKVMDPMPAPDGEEYFVTALYFAHARWGSGKGIYDYRAEADRLLRAMRSHAGRLMSGGTGPDDGVAALFNPEHKQVRFTPHVADFRTNGDHTDPSYHLPAFYEVWARVGPASEAAFWKEVTRISRDFLERTAHPVTGLVPDYAEFSGRPKPRNGDPGGGDFRYDAWRAAMNWSVDHAWWAADPRAVARSDRLQAFFEGQGLWTYANRYHLDGTPIGTDHSLGLLSTNAVASLAASHARAWRFIDELWSARVPQGKWRYYDGLLYLMSLLHVSGQFRPYL